MNEKNDNFEVPDANDEALEQSICEIQAEHEVNKIDDQKPIDDSEAASLICGSLVRLGFVNFDSKSTDNATSEAMVAAELRKHFRRDVYVGVTDAEQNLEFLGRIVEGPFHIPHEVGTDSAITRTTVLHPDRTQFRPSYYVTGTIEILGQLASGDRLTPTPTRPRPYSEISIFSPERLQKFLDINGDFYLGQLMGYEKVNVLVDANNKNFLPRNIGVFGTVGSGKSNTMQVIMEEAIAAGWAVVAVDVEGEYVKMNEPTDDSRLISLLDSRFEIKPDGIKDFKVYVPHSGHTEADAATRFKVPISEIDPFVLADLMELSEAQARLLEAVLEKANNIHRPTSRTPFGNSPQTQSSHPYTLQTIIDALESKDKNLIPTGQDVSIAPLRSKLIRLGRSHMLDWNANQATPLLPISDLLVGGRLSVLDVSETDDRSRNIAIAYTLQSLFDRVIQTPVNGKMPNGNERPKILVVIEEVHTFVSRSNATKMRSVLDNLQIISRRGRKRWMSLALVSQQPGHVPDELFELANTRFIHQLKSASNLTPVKQTTGGVHEALWSTIPSLGPGQCLVTGAIFSNPLFIEVRPAKTKRMLTT